MQLAPCPSLEFTSARTAALEELLERPKLVMHRLFGSSVNGGAAKPKVEEKKEKEEEVKKPTLGDASKAMDARVKELDGKIKELDKELMGYKEQLKRANATTQVSIKKRAEGVLKKKRMYQQQRDNIAGQAFNLDQTKFAIETMQDTQVFISATKDALDTLKIEHAKIDIDDLADLQDEMLEMLEDQEDIQNILSSNYNCAEIDDSELMAELQGLEDDFEGIDVGSASASAAPAAVLPQQPSSVLLGDAVKVPVGMAQGPSRQRVDEYNLPI